MENIKRCLFGIKSYGAFSDSRPGKCLNGAAFRRFRKWQNLWFNSNFVNCNNICNSIKSLELNHFSNRKLVKIYLL